MKPSTKSTLTFLALIPVAACGSDVLRFSDRDPLNPPNTGGNGSGGDDGTDGDAMGGTSTGGGSNGGTGGIVIEPPFGGAGGAGPVSSTTLIDGQSKITDLEATEDGLFWVEYGTYDQLGNFNRDGKLFYLAHGDADPSLLAEDLHGPIELAVTDDEVYMLIEESILISPASRRELWRYDRESDDVDFVTTGRGFIATNGGDAYFARRRATPDRHEVWALDDANPPELLIDPGGWVSGMVVDESTIFVSTHGGFYSLARDGQEQLFEFAYPAFTYLNGHADSLFALERDNNTVYLVEAPKTGGAPWKRIAHLGSYNSVGLGVADGRYFALLIETSGWYTVISGSVQEPMQTQHTFTIRRVGGVEHGKVWTTSPNFFYHTNTRSIFRAEVPPLE